ncbi:hypothetical protein Actkin_05820 [Actinokineospora sp. UTMC 2448]|nr:hypothetical protein Actkin_05820 [Actinokineospora sp. UTMC 2448]
MGNPRRPRPATPNRSRQADGLWEASEPQPGGVAGPGEQAEASAVPEVVRLAGARLIHDVSGSGERGSDAPAVVPLAGDRRPAGGRADGPEVARSAGGRRLGGVPGEDRRVPDASGGGLRRASGDGIAALRAAVAERVGGGDGPEVLPVWPDLAPLFPWGGLRRGATVGVRGSRALLVALMAGAVADGAWAAVVGLPDLGVLAATESGVPAERLALVPRPGLELVRVVAALLDGFAVVAVAGGLREADARRLSARARSRGSVLLAFGSWPGVEVELSCARARWSGPGRGDGVLRERQVEIRARGRGAAARPVRVGVALPGRSRLIA